ncbi:MAG: hypothetical protein Q7W05_15355 [Deltaproteobacteria bacterium]|nr:hypothetical protein [Deltaproteobacteria bacterium]
MEVNNGPFIFTEEQRFGQVWLWVALVGMDVAFFALFFAQFFGPVPPRPTGPADLLVLCLVALLCLGITALFVSLKLITRVTSLGISVQFIPLHRKPVIFPFSDISEYSVRTYRPIMEYGGWGIKRGSGGLAYNVSGNKGLQLVLKDGKRIMIGTQKPEQLGTNLNSAMKQ